MSQKWKIFNGDLPEMAGSYAGKIHKEKNFYKTLLVIIKPQVTQECTPGLTQYSMDI